MKDFGDLLDQLNREAVISPKMVQVMVELTYGCNLRCVHCYNPTHEAKNELRTDQVFKILDDITLQGCLWVGFTGGELFTRRDAMEIMRYAKSKGLVISLLTNATLITPSMAAQIRDLDPYQVDVSVYGATASTYEAVTRVPGSFAHFVRGVDLLVEHRLPTLLKIVLMTLNAHELEAMKRLAAARRLPYKVTTDIHPTVDGRKEPLAYRLAPEQAFEVWKQVNGEEARHALRHGARETCGATGKLFDCLCGKSGAAITPYGELNLCISVYYPRYSLMQGTMDEGWRELVHRVAATSPRPTYECDGCSLLQHCDRGSMNGWLEDGAVDAACNRYYRDIAERKARFLNPV